MESGKSKKQMTTAIKSKQMYGSKLGVKRQVDKTVNPSAMTSGYFSRDQTIDSNPGRSSEVLSEKKSRDRSIGMIGS